MAFLIFGYNRIPIIGFNQLRSAEMLTLGFCGGNTLALALMDGVVLLLGDTDGF